MEKDRFKKLFPHIAEEMEQGVSKSDLEDEDSLNEQDDIESRIWAGYDPDVIDFMMRCDTTEQALEIINFLEKKTEISPNQASSLKKQLEEKGLRSFGPKKVKEYYHRNRRIKGKEV
jgi:hypothetical protein